MAGFVVLGSVFFFLCSHPLSMGIVLVAMTFLISFILYFVINMAWYSYVIILVFLGGMLILFIYVASLASNEDLNYFSWGYLLVVLIIPFIDMIFYFSMYSVSKIYMFSPILGVLIFMGVYLLFVLLAIMSIVKLEGGPLRVMGFGNLS